MSMHLKREERRLLLILLDCLKDEIEKKSPKTLGTLFSHTQRLINDIPHPRLMRYLQEKIIFRLIDLSNKYGYLTRIKSIPKEELAVLI